MPRTIVVVVAHALLLGPAAAAADTGPVALASHTPLRAVAAGNGESAFAASSADGAYVAFASTATDLVPGQVDTNNGRDVFLFERATGSVTLVSHVPASAGTTADGVSGYPRVSADGAFVVFYSGAGNLVAGQSGPPSNIFVFARATGAVTLVSHTATGATTAAGGAYPIASVSPDAASVAFSSTAPDVVAGQTDHNGGEDVFLFERATGAITLVSHVSASRTTTPTFGGRSPSVSADGSFVAFESGATDLLARQRDLEHYSDDVFLFERATGEVRLVSHVPGRPETTGDAPSGSPAVSADGAFVAFESFATNLVARARDGNGTFDVFLFERATGEVRLVSHAAASSTATGANSSHGPAISADGSVVSFTSFAGNLVPGQDDPGDDADVFLFERPTGRVQLVSHTTGSSTTAADNPGGDHIGSHYPALSVTGGYVAFTSTATNLVAEQSDRPFLHDDVFLFERATGAVTLASHVPRSPTTTANEPSGVRPGGRGPEDETPSVGVTGTVAFVSLATDLVTGQRDTNGTVDVFLFQRS
ncbi:MAG TPA: hypothetical protein VHH09_06980 [Acidimicrobiales bacterium]|nr:hypothetical protein [Acidimicrobiales bacterium]